MKILACRLYGENDLRLEEMDLEGAGDDAVVVELVSNSVCMSDYKAVTLATKHKRVPKDIATNPVMVGHEVCGIVREVGTRWRSRFHVGQHVGVQPSFNIPGHELETMGYSWATMGGDATHIRVPAVVIEQGCLLPYDGDAFFKCSLAEPVSCIVSAFRTSYHNAFNTHIHEMGIKPNGTMLLVGGGGAMGLATVDITCHSPLNRPRRLVVTEIDEARLAHEAAVFGCAKIDDPVSRFHARGVVNGVDVHFLLTRDLADPVAALKAINRDDGERRDNPTATGGGYDDVFLYAADSSLFPQASALMGFGGALNFFAGPLDQQFMASFNFSHVHYMGHHCVGSSGGDVKDMTDALAWIAAGRIHPEVMVSHVGGLDSAVETTRSLTTTPGLKRLVYTGVRLPMTAIADFAEKGRTNPFFAALDRLCAANGGLWCKAAEDYLLAHAPRILP